MGFGPTVNWLFLAELVVVVIVCSAFLFYWNRLLGGVIAALIRFFTWRSSNVYLVIGSFQISPLAGRISFRDVEYHSTNISFRALHGHITFQYWLFRVRQEGDTTSNNPKRSRLPCRITVNVEGVEAFFYNRTPAFDAIVERMKKREAQEEEAREKGSAADNSEDGPLGRQGTRNGRGGIRLRRLAKNASRDSSDYTSQADSTYPPKPPPGRRDTGLEAAVENPGISWLREALPIDLQINQGSIILGCDATPMVLIVDFKHGKGLVEVNDSKSLFDLYKMTVSLNLSDVTVLMRSNLDYTGPLLTHGRRVYDELLESDPDIINQPRSLMSSMLGFRALAKRFPKLFDPKLSAPPMQGIPTDRVWKGLARYRLQEEKESGPPHREQFEYAKVATLIKTSSLDVVYYADTAGPVPLPSEVRNVDPNDKIGNIDYPPEFGVDIVVHGGEVNYGPWADRQRDALMKSFAPSIFFDSEPMARLRPGDTRIASYLNVNVIFSEATTLRIPTREPSKDWKFEGAKADVIEQRRFGWLDVVVGPNSTVTYTQSQFATKEGYDSMVALHLDSLKLDSSVNYGTFITAKSCKLIMTMPVPLVWNAQRNWGIDLTLDGPNITLLREHVNLIADLSKDWSGNMPSDFHHYVPMHYSFRLSLVNKPSIHLFLNDFNVVDDPKSTQHNAFLDLYTQRLDALIAVSSTSYRPEFSVVPFSVNLADVRVELTLPTWDTHRTFGSGPSVEVGRIGDLKLSGSYRYYATPRPDHLEKLELNMSVERLAFKAFGWAVRRIFCLKDNYFGSFTLFSTMMEFLEKFDHSPDAVGDPIEEKYRPGRSDAFGVHLTVDLRDSFVVLPDEIYGCSKGIAIPIPQLQLDLVSNELQMDLAIDVAPLYIVACKDINRQYNTLTAPIARSQDVIFIEGLEIKANRLFGPQPKATTYVCIWEIVVDRVAAFVSPEFTSTLAAVGTAVGFNWVDEENAPASIYIAKTPPDATFLKVQVNHAAALLASGLSGIALELPKGLFLDTNSVASKKCRSYMGVGVPVVNVHIVHRPDPNKYWRPVGSCTTGLSLDTFKFPKGWTEEAEQQQTFLREHDAPTRRVPDLYGEPDDPALGRFVNGIYAPRPMAPDKAWMETSSSSITYVERLHGASSSSAGSASSTPSIPRSKLSRRKRSRSVSARMNLESDHDSMADESDSASSYSSASSDSSDADRDHGLAEALEYRLKAFQTIRRRAQRLFDKGGHPLLRGEAPAFNADGTPGLTIEHGDMMLVQIEPVKVELNARSLQSAAIVAGAMGAVRVRPEVMLDQLLSDQVSSALKDPTKSSSTLIIIGLPSVDVQLVHGPFDAPESIIHVAITGNSCRILQASSPDPGGSKLSLEYKAQEAALVVAGQAVAYPALSLLDVPNVGAEPCYGKLLPFARGFMSNVESTYHQTQIQNTIQFKSGDAAVQSVAPCIPLCFALVDQWLPVFSNLPKPKPGLTYAELLYNVILNAENTDTIALLPAFEFEANYDLHVNDQRNIRMDMGWVMLARLRNWLRLSGAPRPRELPRSRAEMASFVVQELCKVNIGANVNEEVVALQPFLRKTFGKDILAVCPEVRLDSALDIFVRLQNLGLQHWGRLLDAPTHIQESGLLLEGATIAFQKVRHWKDEGEVDADIPEDNIQVVLTAGAMSVDIYNCVLPALQLIATHLNRLKETKAVPAPVRGRPSPPAPPSSKALTVLVDVNMEHVKVSLNAGEVRIETSVTHGHGTCTLIRQRKLVEGEVRTQEQNNVIADCLAIQTVALASGELAPPDRVLIFSVIRDIKFAADSGSDSTNPNIGKCNVLAGVETIEFDSRPPLKTFYDFIRNWRMNHWPHYRPVVEELREVFSSKSTPAPVVVREEIEAEAEANADAQPTTVDVLIRRAKLKARAAEALWIAWEIGKVNVSRQGVPESSEFGLRIEPQVIGAYMTARCVESKESSILRLPSVAWQGTHLKHGDQPQLNAVVKLGMFVGVVKPIVIDRLLQLYQRLNDDIMELVQEYRGKVTPRLPHIPLPTPGLPTAPAEISAKALMFRLQANFDGVRIGLRADNVTPTLIFEALDLKGSASNGNTSTLEWEAQANHVGLSLARLPGGPLQQSTAPLRGARSLSMVFDIHAQEIPGSGLSESSKLNINLSRVHTVMHMAALSEVGDLARSWSSDMALLKDIRGQEVAEVKERTARALKSIEGGGVSSSVASPAAPSSPISPHSSSHSHPQLLEYSQSPGSHLPPGSGIEDKDAGGNVGIESWLKSRHLTVQICGVGVAIPLVKEAEIEVTRRGSSSGPSTAGPALLYSIKILTLDTSRTETARFKVQQTYLQFVEKFDSSLPQHFQGQFHDSSNRVTLPDIHSEGQMSSTDEQWNVTAHLEATDFKLTLTPEVADSIGALIDMYEHGKSQILQLENDYRAEWAKHERQDSLAAKYEEEAQQARSTPKQLAVRVSFRFDSGVVELFCPDARPPVQPHPYLRRGSRYERKDTFTLPTVSVWVDYTGAAEAQDQQEGMLLVNLAVHESKNTLRPTILPFFVEIVSRSEQRAKARAARQREQPPQQLPTTPSPKVELKMLPETSQITERAIDRIADAPTGKLRARVTLRIDRSELRLSCAPDSNAYLDLQWESGGFVASTLLGGKDSTTFGGTVSGVTAYLSHEFAEQGRGCIEASAKDLAFSVALCSDNQQHRGLSVAVDTQVAVMFRLEAFSAWLIFMAVWIDNAPKLDLALKADVGAAVTPVPAPVSKTGVAVVVRLRSLDLVANVSVTQATLAMKPIVVRVASNGESTELDVSIGLTHMAAKGDISGDVQSDKLRFLTTRWSSRATVVTNPNVLKMQITAGDLYGNLFIGKLNIVRFGLEPCYVLLADDWSVYAREGGQVRLDFLVKAGKFSGVLRLPVIPRLLGHFYSIFDMVESQKKIASQRSDMFKARRRTHGSMDKTPMTTMVIPTATKAVSAGQPAPEQSHVKTAQTMRFELAGIDVGVFSEDYEDGTAADFYRFLVGKVEADLRRQESDGGLPMRDLELLVSTVEWQTSNGQRATRLEKRHMTSQELIEVAMNHGHRDVVVLPRLTLKMNSTEAKGPPPKLDYDFDAVWGETDGDIKILPNFFDAAFKSFKKLLQGIDDQQLARDRRRGLVHVASAAKLREARNAGEETPPEKLLELQFHRRGAGPWNNPVPKLRALGETTGDAAMMIPRIKDAVGELPAYSHRFVTLPLEDGMDLLLKLYERQLPPDLGDSSPTASPPPTPVSGTPSPSASLSELRLPDERQP